MGCTCCCKAHTPPLSLQKPGTSVLPPLQMGTLAAPDVVLLGLQADAKQRAATVKALEEATAELHKQVHDFTLSTNSLKSEIQTSKKDLDGVKSRLMQHRAKLKACEEVRGPEVAVERVREEYVEMHRGQINSDLIELDSVDTDRNQFIQKIVNPKEEEKTLEKESKSLLKDWAEAMKDVKRLVQSILQLQGDMTTQLAHSTRSSTTVGLGVDTLKEEQLDNEAKLLESSTLRLVESGQRHTQLIQEDKGKIRLGKEMTAVLDYIGTQSAVLRKELESLLLHNVPEVTILEEFIPFPETSLPEEQEAVIEEVEEMQADVQYEEEVMVAAQPDEDAASWHSSNSADRHDSFPQALSAYEAFDLFNAAITYSENGHLPKDCLKTYLAGKDYEEGMYEHWLAAINQYAGEELPYAGLILTILQEKQDPVPTAVAALFPGVIKACNQLVKAVEIDTLAETSDAQEITVSEEVDRMLHTGGLIYWVDCLDLIYATFTPEIGTFVLKSLKPASMSLPDYITFQICHKMHKQQTDGMQIFTLLDQDRSGKLNSDEFSKGLRDLLSLWMEPEDITSTFRSLYNRWSGLVSKIQFSKQVNFEEYIRKTKKEMAYLPKYRLLMAVLEAGESITQSAIQHLNQYFGPAEDSKSLSDEQILATFRIAGTVTKPSDPNSQLQAWKSHLPLPSAAVPFPVAKSTLLAVLCS